MVSNYLQTTPLIFQLLLSVKAFGRELMSLFAFRNASLAVYKIKFRLLSSLRFVRRLFGIIDFTPRFILTYSKLVFNINFFCVMDFLEPHAAFF